LREKGTVEKDGRKRKSGVGGFSKHKTSEDRQRERAGKIRDVVKEGGNDAGKRKGRV